MGIYGPDTEMGRLLREGRWTEASLLEDEEVNSREHTIAHHEEVGASEESVAEISITDDLDDVVEDESWHLCPLDEQDWAAVEILRGDGEFEMADQVIADMEERRSRCLGEVAVGIDYECGLLHGNAREDSNSVHNLVPAQREPKQDVALEQE